VAGAAHPLLHWKEQEEAEAEAGCQHRLLFSQIEFCDNLIFHRRAGLDNLGERLLDANRTSGQRKALSHFFTFKGRASRAPVPRHLSLTFTRHTGAAGAGRRITLAGPPA
jgi:hypothetical protein